MLKAMRRVRLWHVVVLFLILLPWTAYMLRQNSLQMIELRNDLQRADEQNTHIPEAVKQLRMYIAKHMNTSMGDRGVYLEHSYQRAYNQAVQDAQKGDGAATYQQADKDCQNLFSRTASFPAYIQCVTDKVAASGSASDPVEAIRAPLSDLYRYNFVPPVWSADVAGFFVLVVAVLALVIIGWIFLRLFRALSKKSHPS